MERAFLDSLREKADDATTRLVYADWLDEQPGELARAKAEYLRLEARLLEAAGRRKRGKPASEELPLLMLKTPLAQRLPDDWLALVARLPIENCDAKPGRRCPLRWESLQVIDDAPRQRFCKECGERVNWCEDMTTAREHAAAGRCIAIDERVLRKANDLDELPETGAWMGELDPDWE